MRGLVRKYPALLVAVFTLCWAVVEVIGSAAGVSAYQVVWSRYAVHLAFMLLAFGPRYGTALVRTPRIGRQVLSSLCMLGMPVSFIWTMQRLPSRDAMPLLWLSPLFVVVLSSILTRDEGPGKRAWGAAFVGLVGVFAIYQPDGGMLHPSAVLGVATAFCLALYLIIVRSMRHELVWTKLFHTALWVFLVLGLVVSHVWRTPTVKGMLALVTIGLLGWLGLYALDTALELATPAELAPALYTQVVWEELLVFAHGGIPHTARLLTGLLLVAVAGASTFISHIRRLPAPQTT
jgi:drug/metabolite transporter (DMT)-like permease